MNKRKIGIIGGGEHAWVSVERTRKFFIDALIKEFELIFYDDLQQIQIEIDAVINFSGSKGWDNQVMDFPRIFCIHGGAILDQKFLLENLPNLCNFDALVVNCDSDIAVINSLLAEIEPSFCILPLPVQEQIFFPFDNDLAKEIMNLDKDSITIGMISRLLPQKNPHVFIEIIAELKKRTNKKIQGVIVGDFWVDYPVLDYVSEEYPNYLKVLIDELNLENDIMFVPANLSDSELNCVYNAMSFIIHPTNSLDENFGYVPVEAMACGTPVVGALYGGLKNSVSDEVGVGIPTYTTDNGIRMDLSGSFSKIEDLLTDEKVSSLSKNCLIKWEENFSLRSFQTKLIRSVHEIIDNFDKSKKEFLRVKKPDLNQIADELPETRNGIKWNFYRSAVEKYVSASRVHFEQGDYIYSDCKYLIEGAYFTRKDPAWPAKYKLTEAEKEIVNFCLLGPLFYSDCLGHRFNIELIHRMIERGIIVLSKKQWR